MASAPYGTWFWFSSLKELVSSLFSFEDQMKEGLRLDVTKALSSLHVQKDVCILLKVKSQRDGRCYYINGFTIITFISHNKPTKNPFSATVLDGIRDFPSERPQEIKMNSVAMSYGIPGQLRINQSRQQIRPRKQTFFQRRHSS